MSLFGLCDICLCPFSTSENVTLLSLRDALASSMFICCTYCSKSLGVTEKTFVMFLLFFEMFESASMAPK